MVTTDEIILESQKKKILEQINEANRALDKVVIGLHDLNIKADQGIIKLDIILNKLHETYNATSDELPLIGVMNENMKEVLSIVSSKVKRFEIEQEPTQAQLEEGKTDRRGRGKNRKIIEE